MSRVLFQPALLPTHGRKTFATQAIAFVGMLARSASNALVKSDRTPCMFQAVKASVLRGRENFQVLKAIVAFHAVFVVNMFGAFQTATKFLFHQHAMFSAVSATTDEQIDVAGARINGTTASEHVVVVARMNCLLPDVPASQRAAGLPAVFQLGNARRNGLEVLSADRACACNHAGILAETGGNASGVAYWR